MCAAESLLVGVCARACVCVRARARVCVCEGASECVCEGGSECVYTELTSKNKQTNKLTLFITIQLSLIQYLSCVN